MGQKYPSHNNSFSRCNVYICFASIGSVYFIKRLITVFDFGRYYQSQVVKGGGAKEWGEYGLFAMRTGDKSKAEECLREAISLDDSNPDCLAAYP